jgi:hypothetical protein
MVAECPERGKKTLFKYEKRRGTRVRIMVKCANCGYENELDSYRDECEDEDDEEGEDDDE